MAARETHISATHYSSQRDILCNHLSFVLKPKRYRFSIKRPTSLNNECNKSYRGSAMSANTICYQKPYCWVRQSSQSEDQASMIMEAVDRPVTASHHRRQKPMGSHYHGSVCRSTPGDAWASLKF